MKKLYSIIIVSLYLCASPEILQAGASPYSGQEPDQHVQGNNRCSDRCGDGKTVFIVPRVYIEYIGRNYCWSEIRDVEIPIDFFKLQDTAKANGDRYTAGIMSHGNLVDFFTWLLESGRYLMPGDALFGILGYVQRSDYEGLYELYRSFGASRRLNNGR